MRTPISQQKLSLLVGMQRETRPRRWSRIDLALYFSQEDRMTILAFESAEDARLLAIWKEVLLGRGHHGEFLQCFAGAIVRSDFENFAMLRELGWEFARKYQLEDYWALVGQPCTVTSLPPRGPA